jgi:hypothetical protein
LGVVAKQTIVAVKALEHDLRNGYSRHRAPLSFDDSLAL